MIISGTVTSPAVQGVTVQDPADTSPQTGFSPVGLNGKWVAWPSDFVAVAPSVTTTSTASTPTVDWSTAGVFPFTLTNNTVFAHANAQIGQTITLVLTQSSVGSCTGTFPSGSTFVGGSKTLTTTSLATDTAQITCTAAATYLCQLLKAYA
jgi:hypothetical protein